MAAAAQFAGLWGEAAVVRDLVALLAEDGRPARTTWSGSWVGRDEEMRALESALMTPVGEPRPVAICALKGMFN